MELEQYKRVEAWLYSIPYMEQLEQERATERRLRTLPVLVRKLETLREKLHDLETVEAPERSQDVSRFRRFAAWLTPPEILEALIADCKADITVTEYEIEIIKKALKNIEGMEQRPFIKGHNRT